jgi:hypothetical protein
VRAACGPFPRAADSRAKHALGAPPAPVAAADLFARITHSHCLPLPRLTAVSRTSRTFTAEICRLSHQRDRGSSRLQTRHPAHLPPRNESAQPAAGPPSSRHLLRAVDEFALADSAGPAPASAPSRLFRSHCAEVVGLLRFAAQTTSPGARAMHFSPLDSSIRKPRVRLLLRGPQRCRDSVSARSLRRA